MSVLSKTPEIVPKRRIIMTAMKTCYQTYIQVRKKLGYHEGNGILNEGVQYYLGRNKGKNGQHEEKIPVCNVHALTTCSA